MKIDRSIATVVYFTFCKWQSTASHGFPESPKEQDFIPATTLMAQYSEWLF